MKLESVSLKHVKPGKTLVIIIIIYSYTDSAEGHAVLQSVKYKEPYF